ncbi:MAG: hypothetical protein MI810_07705 [Flavobacteriales bacterium]|nr:hypothetical protein [Flavobacteriales bacterium]
MSDFGAILTIGKKGDEAFTEEEFDEILAQCEILKGEITHTNSFGDPYLFKVGKTRSFNDPLCREVNVLLSNHWGSRSDFGWHKEVEARDMKEIAVLLIKKLPKAYNIQSKYDWW